jgi:UDP-N-acetylmuramate dehydrogenase
MNLRNLNTFGINVDVEEYLPITSTEQLRVKAKEYAGKDVLILGGGSNMLFVEKPKIPVFHIKIPGIRVISEQRNTIYVEAGAGVVWHELVQFAINHGYGGIENLSLIPGFCGAAPMQNIGAYGVELTQVFDHLKAVNLKTGGIEIFGAESCEFGYRSSIFKTKLKNQYAISSIVLKLTKYHTLNISYGSIKEILEQQNIHKPTIADVSKAVIKIRTSKLPDPAITGNAGSFFKNPVVPFSVFEKLKIKYDNIPGYQLSEHEVKIPAGWLIETCGWKGKRVGNTGTWPQQALVIINHGEASGIEILETARAIRDDVFNTFNIQLEPEVNLIGINQDDF